MEAMFALKDQQPRVRDSPSAAPLIWCATQDPSLFTLSLLIPCRKGGSVTFNDVHFSYPSNPDRKILNGLSLHIPAGKKVAIVGSSGSGKSTLYRLLYRFYDTDQGQILVDGQDVKQVTLQSLR
jgi:ABC-type multidrug transport system fused ATPase/permease subunit